MDGSLMRYLLCSLALFATAFLGACTAVKDAPPADVTELAPRNPAPPATVPLQTVTGHQEHKIQALERRVKQQEKEIAVLRGQLDTFKHIESDVRVKKKQKWPAAEVFR
jgi:uncharacterized coiled-coil protein SlyX